MASTIKEDLLQFAWRTKRFDLQNLRTTHGQEIHIADFGEHNLNSGPDFLNARIRIGNTLWAGNVEMHTTASEWYRHNHSTDPAYENVILHVVLENDTEVQRSDGTIIPCLELKRRIPAQLKSQYLKLIYNSNWIPCEQHLHTVPELTTQMWLERMLIERLEDKTIAVASLLEQNNGSWEQTYYQLLARNLGTKINAEPMERLARSVPLLLLAKHKDNLLQIEALLFGQAGLLRPDLKDDYPNKLKKEYGFLQQKYGLQSMEEASWKFGKLRPPNFPTIRIAQLARLIHQSSHLFSKTLAATNSKELENMLNVEISNYWADHYVFDKPSPQRKKHLGQATVHLLIINSIAPILFLYGKLRADDTYKDKALALLSELPAEKNTIINKWADLNVTPVNAAQSQALLQLKNVYCDRKQCLKCAIGCAIVA